MSELLNPLQISDRLGEQPHLIVAVIKSNKIAPQRSGYRHGLYDLNEISAAVEKWEQDESLKVQPEKEKRAIKIDLTIHPKRNSIFG